MKKLSKIFAEYPSMDGIISNTRGRERLNKYSIEWELVILKKSLESSALHSSIS